MIGVKLNLSLLHAERALSRATYNQSDKSTRAPGIQAPFCLWHQFSRHSHISAVHQSNVLGTRQSFFGVNHHESLCSDRNAPAVSVNRWLLSLFRQSRW